MKNVFMILLLIAVLGGGVWFAMRGTEGSAALVDAEPDGDRYDFEAQQVLMRQMDAKGRLQYEVEAERIVQLPDRGTVHATGLTLRHDPPGTQPGGPNRWTVNAAEGELPSDGRVVTLQGDVRAQGLPVGRSTPLSLKTESLNFDLDSQDIYTQDVVDVARGRIRGRSKSMRANAATGEVSLESGYVTISPRR